MDISHFIYPCIDLTAFLNSLLSNPLIVAHLQPHFKKHLQGFPGGAVVENLPANAGDTGSNPGLGRSHMPWSN